LTTENALEEGFLRTTKDVGKMNQQFGDEGLSFDDSNFEAGHLFESLLGKSSEGSPKFVADDMAVRNQLPEIKDTDMDIDTFLSDFDRIDCPKYNNDEKDPLNQLCPEILIHSSFSPMGNFNSDNNDFYQYLRQNVFLPLAYTAAKRQNLADIVIDVTGRGEQNSFFFNKRLVSNYNKFESTIMKIFDDIAGRTSDIEANKDLINELIISVLKRFHLYWNFLRYSGRIDKLKVDTKQIMKTIIRNYMMKRDFLNYVSKTLLRGIIQSYYRFIRAHKMVEILNKFGPKLIGSQIVNRYKNFADKIQFSQFNHVMAVKEISYLISLLQVYHILSYKQGINDSNIQLNFKTEIIMRIQREFDNFIRYMPQESQKERLRQIKEYTAVILLKFKHMTFIMFQFHGISQYVNMPHMNYVKSAYAVKIYYELMDNLLMLPKTCVNFLLLKSCVTHEVTKILRFITNKYKIKRSTYGWYFLQELSSMVKSLFSKANEQTWEQWPVFKTYYYSNLFSVMYTYKRMFLVNDMDVVDDLETEIGTIVDDAKKLPNKGNLNLLTADKFDKELYNEFIDIKSSFNSYAPIEKDVTILNILRTRINKFVANFMKYNEKDILGLNFDLIQTKISKALDDWVNFTINKPSTVVSVSTASLSPQFDQQSFEQRDASADLANPNNESLNYPTNQSVNDQINQGDSQFIPDNSLISSPINTPPNGQSVADVNSQSQTIQSQGEQSQEEQSQEEQSQGEQSQGGQSQGGQSEGIGQPTNGGEQQEGGQGGVNDDQGATADTLKTRRLWIANDKKTVSKKESISIPEQNLTSV